MRGGAVGMLLFASACSGSAPWVRGELANHPATLVGEWVDVQKTTPSDSSLWVLRADGYDGGVRIRREYGGDQKPHVERQRYGYWYVRQQSGQAPELCINRRPSREAPSCTPFEISADSTVIPARRTIRLTAYAGAHHTGARLLVERR